MPENRTVIIYYPIESWPWSSILWNQNWPSPITKSIELPPTQAAAVEAQLRFAEEQRAGRAESNFVEPVDYDYSQDDSQQTNFQYFA